MRIGVLTGGGDCPGLNAVIRAVVRKGEGVYGHELVGFRHGWRGVIEWRDRRRSRSPTTRGLLHRGGTILGTLAHEPVQERRRRRPRCSTRCERERIDALIAIGGEDTLGVAAQARCDDGVAVVGVPKTIDNDLSATDFTFGFDTAVQIATDAIDRLHTTAESHDRVMVVEVMGRHAGWIAPALGHRRRRRRRSSSPRSRSTSPRSASALEHRHARGASFSIVVVAEGAVPGEGTMDAAVGRDRRVRPRAPRRHRQPGRRGDRAAHRLRDPGRRSSATCCAAARRRRSTGCSRPGSASRRSTRCTRATSGRWSRCVAPTSCASRSTTRVARAQDRRPPELLRRSAEVFFG